MLKITSIAGNIFHDERFDSLRGSGDFERLKISRMELEKNRIRRETDLGTDVGLLLEAGITLHNGDVLGSSNSGKFIVVEQIPEKVISVRLKNKTKSADLLVLLGHIIGNRHRPISIEDDIIFFPIQAESELEVFQKLFVEIIEDVELSTEEKIFRPHTGADVHGHR